MFDAVLMNLFSQGADIAQITHALTMLKPGGRPVALCANGPLKNASLQLMVDAGGGELEDLSADIFKEAGTGFRVAFITRVMTFEHWRAVQREVGLSLAGHREH